MRKIKRKRPTEERERRKEREKRGKEGVSVQPAPSTYVLVPQIRAVERHRPTPASVVVRLVMHQHKRHVAAGVSDKVHKVCFGGFKAGVGGDRDRELVGVEGLGTACLAAAAGRWRVCVGRGDAGPCWDGVAWRGRRGEGGRSGRMREEQRNRGALAGSQRPDSPARKVLPQRLRLTSA
jgi:hypothetical protein